MIYAQRMVLAPEPEVDLWSIYVWDLGLDRIQEIGSFTDLRLWHLDVTEDVLVAFEINLLKEPAEVCQTKWSTMTGELLDRKAFHLELPAGLVPVDLYDYVCNNGSNTYGHKSVCQLLFKTEDRVIIHLEYDYAVDRLSVHLVYRYSSESGQVAVCNSNTRTVTLHPVQLPDSSPDQELQTSRNANLSFTSWTKDFFGDREVFGLLSQAGVQLWLFNPSFAPDSILDGEDSAGE
ncbi:hypothetical protein VTN49DRAFT_5973 [Thermomyces lanuginosus]|uniref:uncharacterized protein n=1 Tax=Thermomyces lanuginosus TaxID=5541 RepID=UPI003742B2F4